MTTKELEKLCIYDVSSKLHPRRFTIPSINAEVDIPSYYDIEDIYKIIYGCGTNYGSVEGRFELQNEIKKLLNIE